MSKWYEVAITAHKVMMVEMEDDATEEDAYELAINESGLQQYMVDSKIALIEGQLAIDTACRNADEVERL